MGGWWTRVVAALLASVAVAAGLMACGGGEGQDDAGPTATVPRETTTTDPYAVPAVIDEAYVNRVLAGLEQAFGDVVRLVMATRALPPEAMTRLKALFLEDELLQLQVNLFLDAVRSDFKGLKDSPGNRRTTVQNIISANDRCIFAEVYTDGSDMAIRPDPSLLHQWVSLIPIAAGDQRLDYNRTSWGYLYKGFERDLSAPADPCAS